jgi:small subunit ribosomal protein S17
MIEQVTMDQAPSSDSQSALAARTVSGQVASNRMDKTITVVTERMERHPLYGKYVRRRTKLHAHDENNECQIGDTVLVEQCRPLSKTKCWRLVKVIDKTHR